MDRVTMATCIAALACCMAGCSGERQAEIEAGNALVARMLAAPPPAAADDPQAWSAVKDAYALNGGRLLWVEDDAPSKRVARLQRAIANVASDGLDPGRYGLAEIDAVARSSLEAADVRWTLAAVQLARDLDRGVTPNEEIDEGWLRDAAPAPLGALVHQAATSTEVERVLRSVLPQDPQYARLRELLVRYRGVAKQGGLPPLPEKIDVKPGGSAPEVAVLRAHLVASGELVHASNDPVFDIVLVETLKRIQAAHGLEPTGRADTKTLAVLAVPIDERIRQIELNLERMRWLPADLGDPHLVVNVPTYHLTVVERGRPVLGMRIVAGKPNSPTPIFSDVMETLVFSPYWNVPASIKNDEVVPKMMQDPAYLHSQNMEVLVDGEPVDPWSVDLSAPNVRLRQRPGSGNALGHVKFLFPNPFNVYLHDTPSDNLFERSERNFSHGCMRVEQPEALAQWVLGPQPEWTPERIREAMYAGVEKHVALARDVPVHVLYQTVWVDDDGTVRFAEDVYGHDRKQQPLVAAALAAPPRSEALVSASRE